MLFTLLKNKFNKMNMSNLLVKKRMVVICMLLLSSVFSVCGQNSSMPTVESTLDILSSMFRKNDVVDTDLYTGRVSVDIPLYTYKDQDFELPIRLCYSSAGYRPCKTIGHVGLDWYLECGGSITRKINNVADEGHSTSNWLRGYEAFHCLYKSPFDYDRLLQEGKTELDYPSYPFGWNSIETTPDEFNFDFLGYKGTFYLGPDTIYIAHTNCPRGEIKVELLHEQVSIYNTLVFKITTGDGYVYTFKDSEPEVQEQAGYYGGDFSKRFLGTNLSQVPTLTWQLITVEAPNGRRVLFRYKEREDNDMTQDWYYQDFEWGIGSIVDNGMRIAHTCLNTVEHFIPLDRISIDNTSISFEYSSRIPEKWHGENLRTISKLSSLRVECHGELVKQCNFTYSYSNMKNDSFRPVLFLKKIDVTSDGIYSFDYYNENDTFIRLGGGYDFWGYCNGDWDANYPHLHRVDENYVETIRNYEDYGPRFDYTRKGMLQKITYPTKGYTKFYYQQNDYDAKVTKDLTHNNETYLKEGYFGKTTGGVRISKITTYTNDNDSIFRLFDYRVSDQDGARYGLSGILLHDPRFHQIVRDLQGNIVQRRFSMKGDYIKTQDESHISYPQVFEDLPDGSYWQYTFSNYRQLPDLPYDKTKTRSILDSDWKLSERRPLYINEFYAKYDSRHTQRGKLIEKAAYSKTGKLKYVEKYIYDYTKPLSYFVTIANAYSYHYQQKTFIDDYPLVRIEKIYYPENDSEKQYTEVTRFTYNKLGQVINKEVETSDGKWISEKSQYVSDIPVSQRTDAQNKMLAMNMLRYPIRTQTSISGKGVIGGSYAKYAVMDNGLPVISEHWKLGTSSPLPIPDFAFDSFLYKEDTCQYDNWGRLIGVVDQNGQVTTYVWGWLNILAEVKGASPQTVMAKLQPSEDYRVPFKGSSLNGFHEEFLNSIPGATMVTFFAHKELVGVTQMKDTSGRSTFYRYNDDGELIRVEDERGYKSLEYEYHKK